MARGLAAIISPGLVEEPGDPGLTELLKRAEGLSAGGEVTQAFRHQDGVFQRQGGTLSGAG